jgi:hypothetical protein
MKRGREDGFVLVIVVWFVALLAFAAAIIEGWMAGSLREMAALQDRTAARTTLMTGNNRIIWLMVSNFFSVRGLELLSGSVRTDAAMPFTFKIEVTPAPNSPYLALDGTAYRYANGTIALQDERGLFNLNDAGPGTMQYFLGMYDIPKPDRVRLFDTLMDYLGKGGPFLRMQGATQDDYARSGRPPPRHAPLLTPWEPLRVLGWDTQHMWTGAIAFPEMISVSPPQGVNPNTAPPLVLRGIPELSGEAVKKLMNYRKSRPIHDFYQMQDITGETIRISPLLVAPFPSGSLRVRAMFKDDPRIHVLSISLTPTALAPYRIDFALELPKTREDQEAMAKTDLPTFPSLDDIP